MHANEKQSNRNRIDALNIDLYPPRFGFINPNAKAKLREKLGVLSMRLIARPRVGVNHICFAAIQCFHANPAEVECIRNLLHKLATLFSFSISLLYPFSALIVTFTLQFVDNLLDTLVFFSRVLLVKWLVILAD